MKKKLAPASARCSQQSVESVWRQQLTQTVLRPGLRQQLLQREQELLPRFAKHYTKLVALPRRARRSLQRQWKRSLAGVALLLALGQTPALAATINVDGGCILVNAITAANQDTAIGGCTLTGAPRVPDTIVLPVRSNQRLTAVNNTYLGPNGLPVIRSAIIIDGNNSTIQRSGGAPAFRIFAVGTTGNLSLRETTVSAGLAVGRGGGVLNRGVLELTDSTISGNSTSGDGAYGGGLSNSGDGEATLTNSTISGNSTTSNGARGGGVSNGLYSSLSLTNSTISGNSTTGNYAHGGGVYNGGTGAATLTLTNSTISDNSTAHDSSYGGGVFNRGTLSLTRTLVSGNTAPNRGREIFNQGVVSASGFNLFGHGGLTINEAFDSSFGFPLVGSDITATSDGADPTPLDWILKTGLANNGGPTRTHALVTDSPAVDAVPAGNCATQNPDQRGVLRPQGPACDIGSFELQAAASCDGVSATIVGTSGNDTLTGTTGVDVIAGLGGNDTMHGLGGNDRLCGDAGNDIITGGVGNDRIIGGSGRDTARFFDGTARVTANLATGTATGKGADTLREIENLTGSNFADSLTGNAVANVLTGANGNDALIGAGGNDTLNGGGGNDAMNGGPATDTCNGGGGGGDRQTACNIVTGVP